MTNNANQQSHVENKVYIRRMKTWVEVPDDIYREINRSNDSFRKREQYHSRCACPKSKFWLCDTDCGNCEFRRAGDMLSLDYENENGDGDTYSMLDSVTDTSPNVEKIAEDKLLLAALFKRLCELDPDGEIIWQMLAEESSDRAIAKKLGRPQRTFSRQMKRYREELRKLLDF